MVKKKISLSIDEEIWEDANHRISNKSKFFEGVLQSFLYGDITEEQELIQEIEDLNSQLECLQGKLCALRESRKNRMGDETHFDAPMVTLTRFYDKFGCVGNNQIKQYARIHEVDYVSLKSYVKRKGWKIIPFLEANQNL